MNKIDLKVRSEGEKKAYIDGYSNAVKKFVWWLEHAPINQAIKTMTETVGALNAIVKTKEGDEIERR